VDVGGINTPELLHLRGGGAEYKQKNDDIGKCNQAKSHTLTKNIISRPGAPYNNGRGGRTGSVETEERL
jgi:hypothetical protein